MSERLSAERLAQWRKMAEITKSISGESDRMTEFLAEIDALRLEIDRLSISESLWINMEHARKVELDDMRLERDRAVGKLDTPEIRDFMAGVPLEAMHQRKRWGTDHDSGKTPADWFWLVGYLTGKALHAHAEGRMEKALHHVVTTAAALANWHSAMLDKTDMRPGIETPTEEKQGDYIRQNGKD